MSDQTPPPSSFVLYQTEDGRTRIQSRFEDQTIWLSQALIAELFQTTPQNVTMHLQAIFEEGELVEEATCQDCLQVRREGRREVAPYAAPRPSRSLLAADDSSKDKETQAFFQIVQNKLHDAASLTLSARWISHAPAATIAG
ncbi:MAG: hypothetical protein U1F29_05150 [Planctomycetota bacterium]